MLTTTGGNAKHNLGDRRGAIEDYNQAIRLNPRYALAYSRRGVAKWRLGDRQGEGAIEDRQQAARLGNTYAQKWLSENGYDW